MLLFIYFLKWYSLFLLIWYLLFSDNDSSNSIKSDNSKYAYIIW